VNPFDVSILRLLPWVASPSAGFVACNCSIVGWTADMTRGHSFPLSWFDYHHCAVC
jgi:hypothetical protein